MAKKLPHTHMKWSISDPVIKYKLKVHFVADSCDSTDSVVIAMFFTP